MNGEKILVVEDEWVVADQICRNLKDFAYTHSTADKIYLTTKEIIS